MFLLPSTWNDKCKDYITTINADFWKHTVYFLDLFCLKILFPSFMFSELNYFAANVGAYWGSIIKKCFWWCIGSCMVNNVECNRWNSSQLPEIPGWQGNGIFSWVLNCKFLLVGLVYLNNNVAAYFLMYFGKWSFGIGTSGDCCTLLLTAGYCCLSRIWGVVDILHNQLTASFYSFKR